MKARWLSLLSFILDWLSFSRWCLMLYFIIRCTVIARFSLRALIPSHYKMPARHGVSLLRQEVGPGDSSPSNYRRAPAESLPRRIQLLARSNYLPVIRCSFLMGRTAITACLWAALYWFQRVAYTASYWPALLASLTLYRQDILRDDDRGYMILIFGLLMANFFRWAYISPLTVNNSPFASIIHFRRR